MTHTPEHPEPLDRPLDPRDLDEHLRRLAAGVEAPAVPVEEDLARGRARLVRQRFVIGGACLATVGVLGLGATVAPGLGSAAERPDYAGGSASPAPSGTGASATPGTDRTQARTTQGAQTPLAPPPSDHATLAAYQQVLAAHLDPGWDHLVKYTRANGNQQGGSAGGQVTSLGSKYGWRNDGESGLGMLQVSVNAGWSGTYWLCGSSGAEAEGWRCHDAEAPGSARSAEVAVHDDVVEVAVEHEDGQVVVLTASSLFGNNSTVGVSGLDVTEQALVGAAADERLSLPGGAPDVPPLLDSAVFEEVGRATLLASGESLGDLQTSGRSEAWVAGHWLVDGRDRGELSWDATPLMGPVADPGGCFRAQFDRCEHPVVDGKEVLVGHVRAKWGGGFQAIYDGPSYEVRVVFAPAYDGADFPVDRALALVTDDRWQPLN
ncbi:hypothetical protein H5V45_07195 [Nocardioides sp. KIGAM211]|uniref:Uncharacterized protein n=1 Tax=Nocardioides luti TaxID=2761101 RepID=A0A7X0VBE7_9ACTN|nr:hypothetical protein [Nocardioides luti]MBB6627103.1 hypothetical protein [Nocardioides luti]